MSSFHTTTDASFFPCGEDQAPAWPEFAGHNQQATLPVNEATPDPLSSHGLEIPHVPTSTTSTAHQSGMISSHTTTDTRSLPCGEKQGAAWSEVAGHNQQATLSFNGGTPGLLSSHDLDQIFAPVLDDLVKTGFGPPSEAARAGASDPGYTSNIQKHYYHMNTDPNTNAAWFAPTPQFTDSETITSLQSDGTWDGYLLPTPSAPGPQANAFPSSFMAAVPTSQATSAYPFGPGHFAHLTAPYADGDRGMLGPYLNFYGTVGATSWGSAQLTATPLGAENTIAGQAMLSGTYMPALPRTSLGKRPRGADGSSNDFIQATNGSGRSGPARRVKRKMEGNGVLEAAGSTSRARQKPADRIPTRITGKSEATGRGAGMLAAPIVHAVYHQFLPGPSVQEGLMGTTAQGQQPWIEGSGGSLTSDFTRSAAGQLDVVNIAGDVEGEDGEEDGFPIPDKLTDRQRMLLKATPDERARGVVRVLKCVLCPKSGFSKWDSFTRHCDQTEAHPEAVPFCRFCGDFFGRPDARDRHEDKETQTCRSVSPAKAEEKRRVTSQLFEEHQREVDAYLRFGGKAVEPFAQKVMRLYPDSSKRGSRSQNRLKK